jgi:hypothetical protein
MLSLSLNVFHLLVRVLHMVISKRSHLSLLRVLSLFLICQLLHFHSLLLLSQSLPQLLVCPPLFFFFFESNGMYFNTGLKGDLNRSPYFMYTCRLPDFTSEPGLQTSKQHDYKNEKEGRPYHDNKAKKLIATTYNVAREGRSGMEVNVL